MVTATATREIATLAELLDRLGVSPERVRMKPSPGTATESDLLNLWERERILCELVEGTLVEKAVGHIEGYLGAWIIHLLWEHVAPLNNGYVAGADAMMRIAPHLVRMPDVSFISWQTLGAHAIPATPIPDLCPDLAIEVISMGNTRAEMEKKLHEYFDAGVSLVWYIYAEDRTICTFTAPDKKSILGLDDTLDGGTVLPGLALPVARIFERLA